MNKKIIEKIKSIPKFGIILIGIMLLGIFLRTYQFHDWLLFNYDQVRDATLAEEVVDGKVSWPQIGPAQRKSAHARTDSFHLGPIYYHFQIVSAEIFGAEPDKMAYPDLIFSILSIPLMFYFLKRYFSENISLALTGLYSISYFSIQYSRFAWNPNSIPFFVLLFLVSLHEFLVKKEKTHWMWLIFLGASIGIGVQLHMIIFILFPAVAGIAFIFLLKNNWRLWSRWAIVLATILILNSSQIINEPKNNFRNSKAFLDSIAYSSKNKEEKKLATKFFENVDCHVEANAYILSMYDQENCYFSYLRLFETYKSMKFLAKMHTGAFWIYITLSSFFSVIGYFLLFYYFKKEQDKNKKYFLGLTSVYIIISFILMLPVISSGLEEYRYFINVFFVPFIFLGLLGNFLSKKYFKKYSIGLFLFILILIFVAAINLLLINSMAKKLANNRGTDSHSVYLGEIESIIEYIISGSNNEKEAYLIGKFAYTTNLYRPIAYLLKQQGFILFDGGRKGVVISPGKPLFYITRYSQDGSDAKISEYTTEDYKIFGNVIIYKLKN